MVSGSSAGIEGGGREGGRKGLLRTIKADPGNALDEDGESERRLVTRPCRTRHLNNKKKSMILAPSYHPTL